jgi:uracil-DNA glycosylase
VRIVAPVRCAPPANKPTPAERDTCAAWADRELELLGDTLRVVLALGAFAWDAALGLATRQGWTFDRPRPRFGHGATATLKRHGRDDVQLLGCYHVSQQNTFTGKLTEAMLDDVLARAATVWAASRPAQP